MCAAPWPPARTATRAKAVRVLLVERADRPRALTRFDDDLRQVAIPNIHVHFHVVGDQKVSASAPSAARTASRKAFAAAVRSPIVRHGRSFSSAIREYGSLQAKGGSGRDSGALWVVRNVKVSGLDRPKVRVRGERQGAVQDRPHTQPGGDRKAHDEGSRDPSRWPRSRPMAEDRGQSRGGGCATQCQVALVVSKSHVAPYRPKDAQSPSSMHVSSGVRQKNPRGGD
jgi:hypothetical protein